MTIDPLGAALLLTAPLGILGVFLLAFAERVLPVFPSTALYVAIGVSAAEGLWCLPTAFLASSLGGATGAVGTFQLGLMTRRHPRSPRRHRSQRRSRWSRAMWRAARHAAALPFTAQLIPATRSIAPLAGGVLRRGGTRFLVATVAGLAVWNMAFITTGFVLVRMGAVPNATLLSLGLGAIALAIVAGARWVRRDARRSIPRASSDATRNALASGL